MSSTMCDMVETLHDKSNPKAPKLHLVGPEMARPTASESSRSVAASVCKQVRAGAHAVLIRVILKISPMGIFSPVVVRFDL
jgi:hypothetical protein